MKCSPTARIIKEIIINNKITLPLHNLNDGYCAYMPLNSFLDTNIFRTEKCKLCNKRKRIQRKYKIQPCSPTALLIKQDYKYVKLHRYNPNFYLCSYRPPYRNNIFSVNKNQCRGCIRIGKFTDKYIYLGQ